MFYRPSFCSNCGEKIARGVWHIWTSRRFCDVCVNEQPIAEYGPKAVLAAAFVAILAGGTAFLSTNDERESVKVANTRSDRPVIAASLAATPAPSSSKVEKETPAVEKDTVARQSPITVIDQSSVCGAETRKGTPCSRRVKVGARCYQHQGMPAISSIASR